MRWSFPLTVLAVAVMAFSSFAVVGASAAPSPLTLPPTGTQSVPAAPTGVTVTSYTATTVTITWSNPSVPMIDDTIYWATAPTSGFSTAVTNGPTTTYTITGLSTSATDYYFGVVATNAAGSSPMSGEAALWTSVGDSVTDFHVVSAGDDWVDLAWTNPTTAFTQADIGYGTTPQRDGGYVNVYPYDTYNLTSAFLSADTVYYFTISTGTPLGYAPSPAGTYAKTAATQPTDIPAAPTDLASPSFNATSGNDYNYTWTNGTGSNVYDLYVQQSTSPYDSTEAVADIAADHYTNASDTTPYVYLAGYNATNDTYSPTSAALSVFSTTMPTEPTVSIVSQNLTLGDYNVTTTSYDRDQILPAESDYAYYYSYPTTTYETWAVGDYNYSAALYSIGESPAIYFRGGTPLFSGLPLSAPATAYSSLPAAPTDFTLVSYNATLDMANVTWDNPADAITTYLFVYASPSSAYYTSTAQQTAYGAATGSKHLTGVYPGDVIAATEYNPLGYSPYVYVDATPTYGPDAGPILSTGALAIASYGDTYENVTWSAVSGISTYYVYRYAGDGVMDLLADSMASYWQSGTSIYYNETSYANTTPIAVAAANLVGTVGPLSNEVAAVGTGTPAPATDLAIGSSSDGVTTLTWSIPIDDTGLTAEYLYYADSPGGGTLSYVIYLSPGQTSYTLNAATTAGLCVGVTLANSTGASPMSNEACSPVLPAETPTGLMLTGLTSGVASFSWTNGDATTYDMIQIDEGGYFIESPTYVITIPAADGYNFTLPHAASGLYSVTVAACSYSDGGCSIPATSLLLPLGESLSPTYTAPIAPTLLKAAGESTTQVYLSWTNPTAGTYSNVTILYGTASDDLVHAISAGMVDNTYVNGLASDTKYYFAVEAWNGTAGSGPSTIVSATTQSSSGGGGAISTEWITIVEYVAIAAVVMIVIYAVYEVGRKERWF